MKPQHTPTPWHRNIKPASKYNVIFADRNTHVLKLVTEGLSEEEIEANCDFILHACNAHDELVGLLERIKTIFSWDEQDDDSLAKDVCLALAKAKGEK